jgi:predicted ATP-dependent endonuclease of OLD family
MKLTKIYFDAYRSLLNKELEIKHNCLGFVGTNESGKSNVLSAIRVLKGERKLVKEDMPKMGKSTPQLRFEFILEDSEFEQLKKLILDTITANSFDCENNVQITKSTITYTIIYNKNTNSEERTIDYSNLITLTNDINILKHDKAGNYFLVMSGENFVDIENAILLKNTTLQKNKEIRQISKDWRDNSEKIDEINAIIIDYESKINKLNEHISSLSDDADKIAPLSQISEYEESIRAAKTELAIYEKINKEAESIIEEFNIDDLIIDNEIIINTLKNNIDKLNKSNEQLLTKINVLEKVTDISEEQKNELGKYKVELSTNAKKIQQNSIQIANSESKINDLSEPIEEKYTKNKNELFKFLNDDAINCITAFVPTVIFWEYSINYILASETLFETILEAESILEISRPLVNIFRIGLEIKDLEELKAKINEIRENSNERSRIDRNLNSRINDYLKSVWTDYDQQIHISLEKDQIRIEIFDPQNSDNSSYYSMQERSQGCQTFLSFLFTIGAEADHKVLNNFILLLDEPETHLHPSGVRYMLEELIKISERGNLVLYATHSIFLIDRKNLDRHIILRKEKEHTLILPANLGRIGYFMQEEVLYNTLDLNIGKDFASHNKFNFVFEGDGDAKLFSHIYEKILRENSRPFPKGVTSFHQGGKCTDIKKYLIQRPIQLGSKWIFILDKDAPADELKNFIEGKYKEYLNSDVYVFQYQKEKQENDIVLEDLVNEEILLASYEDAFAKCKIEYEKDTLLKLVNDSESFNAFHEQIIKNLVKNNKTINLFKGEFKDSFNSRLKKSLTDKSDRKPFEDFYPIYSKWAFSVIEQLSKK